MYPGIVVRVEVRMNDSRGRRAGTAIAVVILVLLTTAASTAVDRLRTPGASPGPRSVVAIRPPYTFLAVPAGSFALPYSAAVRPAKPAVSTAARSCPGLPAVSPAPAAGARAAVQALQVYGAPDGALVRTLANPTIEGQVLNMAVLERRGFWLRVQLPVRPNQTTGWVRLTDVSQYEAPYRIVVRLCAHRLTVFRGGKAVWEQPVAVGAPRTPTPTGSFYVDFVTPMRYGGAYGPYLMSVAGFSNVLHQFGKGGIGQIGIHGTNRPSSIGTSASHGCVRLHNAVLLTLVRMVPAGTPVTIVD
jgi:lipoprotein-anchoring transpeptidase ErfK/SrfK